MPPHMPTQCTPETRPSAEHAEREARRPSDHLRVGGARRALAQVAVEHHADRRAPAAGPCGVTTIQSRRELDQPVGCEAPQVGAARRRSSCLKSIRCASSIDSIETRNWHISAWITARRTRSSAVSSMPRATGSRPASSARVVVVEPLAVLVVGRADAADRRDAEAEHVALRLRRVALEVALQPALAPAPRRARRPGARNGPCRCRGSRRASGGRWRGSGSAASPPPTAGRPRRCAAAA